MTKVSQFNFNFEFHFSAIAEYLAEGKAPGSSLIPKDANERALMRQRLYFDAGTLYPSIRAIAVSRNFHSHVKISMCTQ